MAETCAIPDCQNNSKKVSLFLIPPPIRIYGGIGLKWIQLIRHVYPNFSPENIYRPKICSEHFKEKNFIPSDRSMLKSFALPTVFNTVRHLYVDIHRWQINNTAAGMNSAAHDMSVIRNNTGHTYSIADCVSVPSVPNPSNNTIETRPTTQNVSNPTSLTNHAGLQEHSNQTVVTSSRSLRTRKRKFACHYCNAIDSEVYNKRIKRI
ncbi:uncharacterized protein LOC132938150 [Metopolophium dirhodum]|uniref:uncharacterized protein LOC132938150 n=1 Tax=Metopolophium dirhodum TaxID=44670 RepID=UPI00299015C1|nr:uncharacterized protein LOC132938150 [Metopolophium dirhodum]